MFHELRNWRNHCLHSLLKVPISKKFLQKYRVIYLGISFLFINSSYETSVSCNSNATVTRISDFYENEIFET